MRVKLCLKKTSSESICDYCSLLTIDEFHLKFFCPSSILNGRNALLGNVSSSSMEKK